MLFRVMKPVLMSTRLFDTATSVEFFRISPTPSKMAAPTTKNKPTMIIPGYELPFPLASYPPITNTDPAPPRTNPMSTGQIRTIQWSRVL
jgi:hypothetical protein